MTKTDEILVFLLLPAVILLIFLPGSAHGSGNDLMEIAVDSPLSGWTIVPESTVYGSGDGLQQIYNGGYEVYTGAGILDALRRMYAHGGEYIEVTVHTAESPQSALAFLSDRHRMETGEAAPLMPDRPRFTASGAGSTTAYAARGSYFIIVVAYHGGDKGRRLTARFMASLEENAAKLLAARQQE